jgi:type IV pilus assembly protein PilV
VTAARNIAGFTLLEVMIAMFVLGFGLLALEMVQLKTYAAARESELQSIVALHTESLAEAMRANPKRSEDAEWHWHHYLETKPGASTPKPSRTCTAQKTDSEASIGSRCDQDSLARYELYLFKARLAAAFPKANNIAATVCPSTDLNQPLQINNLQCDASGPLAIKVAWRIKPANVAQSNIDTNGRTMSYQLRFTP